MEILFASGNRHKRGEIASLFPDHSIILPAERDIAFDVEETGSSFLENAMIKAMALRGAWTGAILADDSGLCVRALNGAPGIYSARYGSQEGEELESASRNELLIEEMRGKSDRACCFACCMVLSFSKERFYVAQETMDGLLLDSPRGARGFGYDPIVWIESRSRSVAELLASEKNLLSHRGKASRRILAMLDSR